MMGPILIAKCAVHGIHGERQECFVCGGPVEQVPMIPVEGWTIDELTKTLHAADGLLSLIGYRYREAVGLDLANDLQVTSGLCRSLVRRIEEAMRDD